MSIKFNPHDIWVGIYWKSDFNYHWKYLDIYICIIPCFPIHFEVEL